MNLPILPPNTDFKRNYNFLWKLRPVMTLDTGRKVATTTSQLLTNPFELTGRLAKFNELMNPLYYNYISSMAESVELPEDGIETEDYSIGNIDIPVPKKIKREDIQVIYLDDTDNRVYNFHQGWMSLIKGSNMSFSPISQFTISGVHYTLSGFLNRTQYLAISQAMENDVGNEIIYRTVEEIGKEVTGTHVYTHIYPTSIKRESSTRGGAELSKVTVIYRRVPRLGTTFKPVSKAKLDMGQSVQELTSR